MNYEDMTDRELSWEVAKFMGVDKSLFDWGYEAGNHNYAANISDAWEVIEKLKHKLQIFTFMQGEEGFEDGWLVKIDGEHAEGIASAPRAISIAALKAMDKE